MLAGTLEGVHINAAYARSLVVMLIAALIAAGCGSNSDDATDTSSDADTSSTSSTASGGLDLTKFFDGALASEATTEACTLSGGAEASCYKLTLSGAPASHEIGPFCPSNVADGADKGGIWFDGEAVYDLSGSFFKTIAATYDDPTWSMVNPDGSIKVTDTAEKFAAAARPDVDPALQNHCVEGRMEWLDDGEPIQSTVLIPTEPVKAEEPVVPRGNMGVTLDGVLIAASAPVSAILGAYTIAAFDDCGGHINPAEGYHLHGAAGCSEQGEAVDGETAIFGYASDGYAVHSPIDDDKLDAADLDACSGHATSADGYHYHAQAVHKNQVIACLVGQTVEGADDGAGGPPGGGLPGGGPPGGGPPGGGPPTGAPDDAVAAAPEA